MDKNVGYVIVFISTASYALLTPLLKKASEKIPPFTLIAISMFVLFLCSFLVSIFLENSLKLKIAPIKTYIWTLVVVGVINALAFWLQVLGYKYMPIWQQALFGLLSPLLSGVFAYYILGEQMSAKLFLGLIVMGIGLFVAVR